MKFNHIGIFVKNLKDGEKLFTKLLNIKNVSKKIDDKNLKVSIQFIVDESNITYEIVAPFGKNNPVEKILKENRYVLNHIAYSTKNFDKTIRELRNDGYAPLGPAKKALAFKGARVIFFITPLNFIVEIIEEKAKDD